MNITTEARRQLYIVLQKLKSKSDLTQEPSDIQKRAIQRLEEEHRQSSGSDIIISSRQQEIEKNFTYYPHKKIRLYQKDSADCSVEFLHELKNIFATLRAELIIIDFRYITTKTGIDYYEISLPANFDAAYPKYEILFRPNEAAVNNAAASPKTGSHSPVKVGLIECVKREPNNSKLTVVVNKRYLTPLEVNFRKYWTKLYELAEKGQIVSNGNKGFFDYFNSNLSNPIYSQLKCKQSQILKFDGGVRIVANVPIEIITGKKITQRKNILLKKT